MSDSRAITDHAAQIARNEAFWRECGAATVRRDSELADDVARADLQRETQHAGSAALWKNIGAAFAAGACQPQAPAHPAVDSVQYYDDQGMYAGPEVAAELTDSDRRFAYSAEGEYAALCREMTGASFPEAKVTEWREDAAKLLAMSHELAARAEAAGLPCYRETPFGLWRYYIHSRHVEKLPNFRRIMFIPHVAQSVRAPIVSALESFLQHWTFARFWTFTSGPRVLICDVRRTAQDLHRRISRLNDEPIMKRAGAEIVLRSTETGTPEELQADQETWNTDAGNIERDEAGRITLHVHSHCVMVLTRGRLSKKRWRRLLRFVGRYWKHRWKDGSEDKPGPIRDARECVKYMTKPAEMLKLSGAELFELQAQLSGLKLVQPMGLLADEIRARKKAGLRLVRKRTPDGPVYRSVKNWNRHGRKTETEKHQEAAAALSRPPERRTTTRILARQLPRIGPAGVAEPTVTVMAQEWSEKEVRTNSVVAKLIRRTAHEFWAGHAINVHTRTATVGNNRELEFVSKLDPPRHVPTGAELSGFSR